MAKGYVILDGAAFPIVGEGDEEPNDTFRKQLVANAKAAKESILHMLWEQDQWLEKYVK